MQHTANIILLKEQAEPPTIVVATLGSLSQMLEKNIIKLESTGVLVIDEVKNLSSLLFVGTFHSWSFKTATDL